MARIGSDFRSIRSQQIGLIVTIIDDGGNLAADDPAAVPGDDAISRRDLIQSFRTTTRHADRSVAGQALNDDDCASLRHEAGLKNLSVPTPELFSDSRTVSLLPILCGVVQQNDVRATARRAGTSSEEEDDASRSRLQAVNRS